MKKHPWLLIVLVLAIISLWWWLASRSDNTVSVNPITQVADLSEADVASRPTAEEEQSDVDEAGFGTASVDVLTERLKLNPWAKDLPQITEHYTIYYEGKDAAPELSIILESKNGSEFEAYKKEALDWLRAASAPVDKLKITFSYRGQS
jgi:hypothetical protein